MPQPDVHFPWTIDERILAEIEVGAVQAAGVVGLAVDLQSQDRVEIPAVAVSAALRQGELGGPDNEAGAVGQFILDQTAAGRIVVEVAAGESVADDADTRGGFSSQRLRSWVMPVAIGLHLPTIAYTDTRPPAIAGQPSVSVPLTMRRLGLAAAAQVADMAGSLGPRGVYLQCGRWLNFATRRAGEPENMPLATETMVVSAGGIGVSELGTAVALVGLEVKYRTQEGDPGAVG